jgi:hypothetical protein
MADWAKALSRECMPLGTVPIRIVGLIFMHACSQWKLWPNSGPRFELPEFSRRIVEYRLTRNTIQYTMHSITLIHWTKYTSATRLQWVHILNWVQVPESRRWWRHCDVSQELRVVARHNAFQCLLCSATCYYDSHRLLLCIVLRPSTMIRQLAILSLDSSSRPVVDMCTTLLGRLDIV